jgi:hypothetical protein
MPRKLLFVLVILGVTAMGVSAQATDAANRRFESAGYEVIRTRSQGGMPVWDLETTEGRRFSVHMIGALSDERIRAVSVLEETIHGLDGLEIERMRIVFDDNRASAIVIPESFTIEGRRYEDYMPSGMQFIFDDAPSFDFRMLVDNLAVRINGAFLTAEQFLVRIQRAVENPAAYIQSSDPQFLAEQIRELQRIVDTLEVAVQDLSTEDERIEATLRNALEETRDDGVALVNRWVRRGEAALDEVNARIDAFSLEVEEAFDNVSAETLDLTGQFEKLRQGSIVLASRNLFGSLKEVAPETVAAVVELRTAEPDLTADDAMTRVNETLSEEAVPLHSKHVQAIYALYFND